jgi:hypothetical protein
MPEAHRPTPGQRQDETNSISRWVDAVSLAGDDAAVTALRREEEDKYGRLARLGGHGLPVYPARDFDLPRQLAEFDAYVGELTADGIFTLAVRLSDARTGHLLLRRLGITAAEASEGAALTLGRPIRAHVASYMSPTRSGTLWIRRGDIHLEAVDGPHYWITKASEHELDWCRLSHQQTSIEYSAGDPKRRAMLYRMLRDVLWLVLGSGISVARGALVSLYTEFHWHPGVGYLFIECSFADPWTGSKQHGLEAGD